MYQIAKEIIGNSMREPNFKKFLLSPPLTSSRASSCGNEIANRRKNSSTARYSRHGHKNKRKKEFYYNGTSGWFSKGGRKGEVRSQRCCQLTAKLVIERK